jgi:CTP-dependent riboflavin kinase
LGHSYGVETMKLKLRGRVRRGIEESANFTQLPWVRAQFIEKLGIDPYPGTLNLEVREEDLEKLALLREGKGVEITPQEAGFCAASGFPALVGGKVKAAVIVPCVGDYPENKLELISATRVREALALKEGDVVEVEVSL